MNEPLKIWSRDDYPMLKAWWEGHGFPAIPADRLPPLGAIFGNAAAGWAYMDNGGTGVAMMEWLVTDPKAGRRGLKALGHVIDFLTAELQRNDYGFVLATCRQPTLARFLERHGFVRTDEQMIHLVKIIE